jgi:6-phosphogluconate dehydrogenase
MLQGIIAFRFSNALFEPSWNAESIERIDITLRESIGVEGRGAFYDGIGALRDVGQNHLLQMLALVTMEQPEDLTADSIRAARLAALHQLQPLVPEEIELRTFRAQYDGYTAVEGVDPASDTETYLRIETVLTGKRWGGVPVTMESGKRMGPPLKQIEVTFKPKPGCLCHGDERFENSVVFQLEPEETIKIKFWAKQPGFDAHLVPREFTYYLHESEITAQYVEEYAKLLLDAIAGDQTLFVSTGEVLAMWRFIDPIVRSWAAGDVPLEYYTPDSAEVSERAAAAIASRLARDLPEVGIVGLGRMGKGIALHLLEQGWRVVGYNRTASVAQAMVSDGLDVAFSYAELAAKLTPPRVVWLQLPAGEATENAIFGEGGLASVLEAGDTIVDGSNSFWRTTQERAERLTARGIHFLDVGVSGGPAGARRGASLMIGGRQTDYERLMRLWQAVAVRNGLAFFPGHGAGHFVKMVHNGIEYGMMQAIAEGFTVLRASPYEIDLTRAAEVYNNGSVIESRLIGWMQEAFQTFGENLVGVSGSVGHTGEAQWAVRTAEELGVPVRVIEAALDFRLESEDNPSYTGRILQAMRNRFGGHPL